MAKKKVKVKTDGYGPEERRKISAAIRQVWQRSYARRLCVKRASLPGDYFRCELCGLQVPKVHIDHKEPAGTIAEPGFIERLFCPSDRLQAICPTCHGAKTKIERAAKRTAA